MRLFLPLILSSMSLGISATALIGYAAGKVCFYHWHMFETVPISLPASLCIFFLSVGSLIHAVYQAR